MNKSNHSSLQWSCLEVSQGFAGYVKYKKNQVENKTHVAPLPSVVYVCSMEYVCLRCKNRGKDQKMECLKAAVNTMIW